MWNANRGEWPETPIEKPNNCAPGVKEVMGKKSVFGGSGSVLIFLAMKSRVE
jgi:hypothetical protein